MDAGGERGHCRHGRETVGTAATQQLQQQCLRLIVLMMGGKQTVAVGHQCGDGAVAGMARRRLGTLSRLGPGIDTQQGEGDRQFMAHRRAMLRPGGGSGLQAMIHMHGMKGRQPAVVFQLRGSMQQDMGIATAAVGQPPPRHRRQTRQDRGQGFWGERRLAAPGIHQDVNLKDEIPLSPRERAGVREEKKTN